MRVIDQEFFYQEKDTLFCCEKLMLWCWWPRCLPATHDAFLALPNLPKLPLTSNRRWASTTVRRSRTRGHNKEKRFGHELLVILTENGSALCPVGPIWMVPRPQTFSKTPTWQIYHFVLGEIRLFQGKKCNWMWIFWTMKWPNLLELDVKQSQQQSCHMKCTNIWPKT